MSNGLDFLSDANATTRPRKRQSRAKPSSGYLRMFCYGMLGWITAPPLLMLVAGSFGGTPDAISKTLVLCIQLALVGAIFTGFCLGLMKLLEGPRSCYLVLLLCVLCPPLILMVVVLILVMGVMGRPCQLTAWIGR